MPGRPGTRATSRLPPLQPLRHCGSSHCAAGQTCADRLTTTANSPGTARFISATMPSDQAWPSAQHLDRLRQADRLQATGRVSPEFAHDSYMTPLVWTRDGELEVVIATWKTLGRICPQGRHGSGWTAFRTRCSKSCRAWRFTAIACSSTGGSSSCRARMHAIRPAAGIVGHARRDGVVQHRSGRATSPRRSAGTACCLSCRPSATPCCELPLRRHRPGLLLVRRLVRPISSVH